MSCGGQCGGIDCICDVLCGGGRSVDDDVKRTSERVRSEAAGVVAQITSPSLVVSPRVDEIRRTSLINNMADLVPALTGTLCLKSVLASCAQLLFYLVHIQLPECGFASPVQITWQVLEKSCGRT